MTQLLTSPHITRKILKRVSPTGKVLTVYLDTSIQRAAEKAHLLAQRDGCKAIRPAVSPAEQPAFEAAVAQVERYLATSTPSQPGLAIFASGSPAYFFAVPMAAAPEDRVDWETQPRIGPLEEAIERGERYAVALVDIQRARLFTIAAGAVEERRMLDDYVTGRHGSGGWAALNQSRAAHHRDELIHHHVERTIRSLEAILHDLPFRRLLIGGPVEASSLLRNKLPPALQERLAGTIAVELLANDAEIVQSANAAIAELERNEQRALVDSLLAGDQSPATVVGIDSVLYALGDDRVERLVIADQLRLEGVECESCGRLAALFDRCPRCGERVVQVADLVERAVERALTLRAELTIVTDGAAERLLEAGGAAATLRY